MNTNVDFSKILNKLVISLFFALFVCQSIAGDETQTEVAERIALEFVSALNAGDKIAAQNLLDIDRMATLITDQIVISPAAKRGFVRGFKGSVSDGRFIDNIINISPNETSTYSFQRMNKTKEFGLMPVIRIDFSEGGHEFIMIFVNETEKIEDFYFGSKGNRTSTVAASAAQLLIGSKSSMLGKLLGTKSFDAALTAQFEKMVDYRNEGKIVESYEILKSLPEALQKSRFVIDFGVLLGQQIGDEPYMLELGKLNKYFGEDDSTAFMLIDYHFMNNDLPSALKSLEKAMVFWGEDDGALLVIKSNIYVVLEDYEQAIAYAQLALESEPEFNDAYWQLASLYNIVGDYQKLTQVFMTINQLFDWGIDADTISAVDEFQAYSQSEEFEAAFR